MTGLKSNPVTTHEIINTIVSATDNTNAIANIVAKKDGEYHFIAVTGYCDNEEPEIDLERKLRLQSLGDMFNAKIIA